jgi:putative FmdB family regulatory protein
MPIYVYICDTCKKEYSTYERIFDDPHDKCKLCNDGNVVRKIFPPQVINSEPRTLGSLAEKNSAKMGVDELAARDEEYRTRKNERLARHIGKTNKDVTTPETKCEQEKMRKINKMTPEQKEKYIMTGKGL